MGIQSNTEYDVLTSGTITALNGTLDVGGPNSAEQTLQVTGTWSGTLVLEVSNDGSTWVSKDVISATLHTLGASITANGIYLLPTNGFANSRIRASTWTSGTAVLDNFGSDTVSQPIVADGLRSGGLNGSLTLTTGNTAYEAKVGGSRLSGRSSLIITANDNMYWGYSSSVTTSTGTPLYKNQQIQFTICDNNFEIWLVASANNKSARIAESL